MVKDKESWLDKPLTPKSLVALIVLWFLIMLAIGIIFFIIGLIFPSFGGSS